MAKAKRWPEPGRIDFEGIPLRLRTLTAEIRSVFANEIVLQGSAAWQAFLKALQQSKVKFVQFGKLNPLQQLRTFSGLIHAG